MMTTRQLESDSRCRTFSTHFEYEMKTDCTREMRLVKTDVSARRHYFRRDLSRYVLLVNLDRISLQNLGYFISVSMARSHRISHKSCSL